MAGNHFPFRNQRGFLIVYIFKRDSFKSDQREIGVPFDVIDTIVKRKRLDGTQSFGFSLVD
jgi:hypothetical protein